MEEVIPLTVTVFKTILDSFPVLSAFFFADLFFFLSIPKEFITRNPPLEFISVKLSKGIYYSVTFLQQ